ncbi:unnamed protein product [Caenorhabditis auriculariae]|uniref:Protein kinase domain-containing protein n=1 Tax=Caenorhabditis auriculariae TaxID=2777116 RepID=A0A8S1GPQ4_9PELO|nr:unnamed protein product [Caenorhabditis auriculariae]
MRSRASSVTNVGQRNAQRKGISLDRNNNAIREINRQPRMVSTAKKREETNELFFKESEFMTRIESSSAMDEQFEVGRVIGRGNFSSVHIARRRSDGFKGVIKQVDKRALRDKCFFVENEVEMLALTSRIHENIIGIIDAFQSPSKYFLFLEYAKYGDLFETIRKRRRMGEREAAVITAQIASALDFLHDSHTVHRDVKPENIFLVGPSSVKLGDFGLACVERGPLYRVCGTPTYCAPEILKETGYGVKVDVWSLGVVLHVMLVGRAPFIAQTQQRLFKLIVQGKLVFEMPDYKGISIKALDLMSRMMRTNAEERPHSREIISHPWIVYHSNNILINFLVLIAEITAQNCSCNPSTSWNDVTVLIDWSSEARSNTNFAIQSIRNNTTRLGVTFFSDKVQVKANLGSGDRDSISFEDVTLSSEGTKGLRSALQVAMDDFRNYNTDGTRKTSPRHRVNSRKVIALFIQVLSDSDGVRKDTELIFEQFRENGGILYIYQMSPTSRDAEDEASRGYYSTMIEDPMMDSFREALCDANCFCPDSVSPYRSSLTGKPEEGCYYPSNAMANLRYAERSCSTLFGSYGKPAHVSAVYNKDQADFLLELAHVADLLIGLSRSSVDEPWRWMDGSTLGESDYQPWMEDAQEMVGVVVQTQSGWKVSSASLSTTFGVVAVHFVAVAFIVGFFSSAVIYQLKYAPMAPPGILNRTKSTTSPTSSTAWTVATDFTPGGVSTTEDVPSTSHSSSSSAGPSTSSSQTSRTASSTTHASQTSPALPTVSTSTAATGSPTSTRGPGASTTETTETYASSTGATSSASSGMHTSPTVSSHSTQTSGGSSISPSVTTITSNLPFSTTKVPTSPQTRTSHLASMSPTTTSMVLPMEEIDFGCGVCNTSILPLNFMLIFQVSKGVNFEQGVQQMESKVKQLLQTLLGNNETKKIGIVSYDDNVYVVRQYSEMTSSQIDEIKIGYNGLSGTNLYEALIKAINQTQLGNLDSGSTANPVFILVASTENRHGVRPAINIVREIQASATFIVYESAAATGGLSDAFPEYSSPGFYGNSMTGTLNGLIDPLCDALCTCSPKMEYIPNPPRNAPKTGCYKNVPISASYDKAIQACASLKNDQCDILANTSIVAIAKTLEEDNFLHSRLDVGQECTWIGLKYDFFYNRYVWADHSFLLASEYNAWPEGIIPVPAQNETCVASCEFKGDLGITWKVNDSGHNGDGDDDDNENVSAWSGMEESRKKENVSRERSGERENVSHTTQKRLCPDVSMWLDGCKAAVLPRLCLCEYACAAIAAVDVFGV